MLTEQKIIGKIEILPDGQIQIREDTQILRDGVKISETYHRHVIAPDQDIKDEDEKVKAVAAAVWTKEVKDRYIANKIVK